MTLKMVKDTKSFMVQDIETDAVINTKFEWFWSVCVWKVTAVTQSTLDIYLCW